MTKTGGHFTLRISSTTHTRTQEHGFDYTFQRTHSTASLNDVAFDVFSIFPIETCLPLRVDFTRLTPMARKQTTLKAGKAGKSKTSRNVSSETKSRKVVRLILYRPMPRGDLYEETGEYLAIRFYRLGPGGRIRTYKSTLLHACLDHHPPPHGVARPASQSCIRVLVVAICASGSMIEVVVASEVHQNTESSGTSNLSLYFSSSFNLNTKGRDTMGTSCLLLHTLPSPYSQIISLFQAKFSKTMTTFTRFIELPRELRDQIWSLAIRDDHPGAHIFGQYVTGSHGFQSWRGLSFDVAAPSWGRFFESLDENRSDENISTYLIDGGLWTACHESRCIMEDHLRQSG
ncbi:unnamed protein product [Fusarium fujikuroi]|uniref:2EXR domain-containing protein n=1 Tax=Fusarium fujikuroi TaxID=5127 RepID=A0A9Q9RJJ3_FUSFU|nr:unnamed protein product [Fusarium fujikuroi]